MRSNNFAKRNREQTIQASGKDASLLDLIRFIPGCSPMTLSRMMGVPDTTVHYRIRMLQTAGLVRCEHLRTNDTEVYPVMP